MKNPASYAFVIHSFWPLSTQWSPFSAARHAGANASEPDPGSESAYAPTVSFASIERYFDFWSSVPQRRMALLTSVFWTSTSTPHDASTWESSSTTSTAVKNDAPAPPHWSGTSMPMMPRSKNAEINSFDICASWSIRVTSGRIFSTAKSRTLCWNICSSSDRTVRGLAVGSDVAVVMVKSPLRGDVSYTDARIRIRTRTASRHPEARAWRRQRERRIHRGTAVVDRGRRARAPAALRAAQRDAGPLQCLPARDRRQRRSKATRSARARVRAAAKEGAPQAGTAAAGGGTGPGRAGRGYLHQPQQPRRRARNGDDRSAPRGPRLGAGRRSL